MFSKLSIEHQFLLVSLRNKNRSLVVKPAGVDRFRINHRIIVGVVDGMMMMMMQYPNSKKYKTVAVKRTVREIC